MNNWDFEYNKTGGGNVNTLGKIRLRNVYGIKIPPFAAMKANYNYTEKCFDVTVPDDDNLPNVLINGSIPIMPGATIEIDHLQVFKALTESCVVGDSLGTQAGSFILKRGNTGFVAMAGSHEEIGDSGGVVSCRFFNIGYNIKKLDFSIDISNYNSGAISSYISRIDIYTSEQEITIPANSMLYFSQLNYILNVEDGTYGNPITVTSHLLFCDAEDNILAGFYLPYCSAGKYGELPETFKGSTAYYNWLRYSETMPQRPISYNMANISDINFSKLKLSLKSGVQAGCQSSNFSMLVSGIYAITLSGNWWLDLPE